jgi:hypothetical protein
MTPLDNAREQKVKEWERKLHEIIDHHDSLARELYHLETYTTTLTYDPIKIKLDRSERMLRVGYQNKRVYVVLSKLLNLITHTPNLHQ